MSEGAAKYQGGFKAVSGMVQGMLEGMEITVPVALHLDHGTSFENCKAAMDAGFSSVMIDASHGTFEHNVETTKAVVEYAKTMGVSVEAELGTVGGEEDGIIGGIMYADKDECVELCNATGINALAPALGSVHGPYIGEPKLGFDEMKEISEATDMPLVLHGGSGIPVEQIQKAISLGTSKINVNTECQQAFTAATKEFFVTADIEKTYDPRKVLAAGTAAITATVAAKMAEFGSINKA